MTLNELIKQLQDKVSENPKVGECEVYIPYDEDNDSIQISSDKMFFSVSPNFKGENWICAYGDLPSFKEAEEYLQEGIKDGGFSERDPNRIVFQIGYF